MRTLEEGGAGGRCGGGGRLDSWQPRSPVRLLTTTRPDLLFDDVGGKLESALHDEERVKKSQ